MQLDIGKRRKPTSEKWRSGLKLSSFLLPYNLQLKLIDEISQQMIFKANSFSNYDRVKVQEIQLRSEKSLKDLKILTFKKSIFSPKEAKIKSYQESIKSRGQNYPRIQIIHLDSRWLLMQSDKYNQNFFQKISKGKTNNQFSEILAVFRIFQQLVSEFGYFKVSKKMIFSNQNRSVAWFSEDLFDLKPMLPINASEGSQKKFIQSFLSLLNRELILWKPIEVKSMRSLEQALQKKAEEEQISNERMSKFSKQAHGALNEERQPFSSKELKYYKNQPINYQSQEIKPISVPFSDFYLSHVDICDSAVMKEPKSQVNFEYFKQKETFQSIQCRKLKESIYQEKQINEKTNSPKDFRQTKKKFTVQTASSLIEKYSQKSRETLGKKVRKYSEKEKNSKVSQQIGKMESNLQKKSESIENQLDGLFGEEPSDHFYLDGEVPEHLEKITEEMEDILHW